LIIFDASALVSAALKADSIPERALLRAEEVDVFALSAAVDREIAGVLNRPRFARAIPLAPLARRAHRASGGLSRRDLIPLG
jgi:predicted nucleic acid-binding protein